MSENRPAKNVWEEIADLFYGGNPAEGMKCFMEHVSALGQLPAAAPWVNPLFDALDQGDYLYAADLLRYEIAG